MLDLVGPRITRPSISITVAEISKEIDRGMIEEEHDWRRRAYEVATSRDIKVTLSLSLFTGMNGWKYLEEE